MISKFFSNISLESHVANRFVALNNSNNQTRGGIAR
ncbi:MAG: hypothetical protein ACI8XC_000532 [Gammaproteobacteria bacterium]|jgi:hypothetical protein